MEVINILQAWLDGNLDSHDWDDFLSVKNKNPNLEDIRYYAEGMWVENSKYLQPDAINPCLLSDLGRKEVKKLLAQCNLIED